MLFTMVHVREAHGKYWSKWCLEATKGTSLKIEVTSKDLLEFADALVERAAAKARTEIERQSDVEYIPKKEAIDLLGVCDATLWHWARSGYLVPVKLGRRVFYRRTDIQRIMQGRWKGKGSRIHRFLDLSVIYQSPAVSELVENVSRLKCRKHACTSACSCVCVCTCLRIYVFAYLHIHTFVCLHTNMLLCSYTDMRQNSSCSFSKYIASRHVIVSHNRPAFRRVLVQIARCVYVSRTRGN